MRPSCIRVRGLAAASVVLLLPGALAAREAPRVLRVRDQVAAVNSIRLSRLDALLPRLMREAGIDMWILASNEDNHDPVFRTMVPVDTWHPITQIMVLYDRGEGRDVERLSVSRTDMSAFHERAWDARAWDEGRGESQWECLRRIVAERKPRRIGVNEAEVQWAADSLTRTMRARVEEAIGPEAAARLVSAEPLVTLWLETMLDEEIGLYEHVIAVARDVIAATFASPAIVPGTTTLDDLRYIYWQLAVDRGLEVPVPPHFCLRRAPAAWKAHGRDDRVVRRGDLVHTDLVVRYLGYYSDHQEWGYLLRPGETEAPAGYRHVLKEGNRLQDVFVATLRPGITGNQMLATVLERARGAGISSPRVYSHSIGQFLHEPGPLIGLPWEQEATGARGDVRAIANSSFSAELSVRCPLEEWGGEELVMGLEEEVVLTPEGVRFLAGRQTDFHLVR